MPPAAVVADANVLLSALIGGRARLVLASANGPRCFAPEAIAVEIAEHLPELAAKRQLDLTLLFAGLRSAPVQWRATGANQRFEEEALKRIAARDPDDWPVVALALAMDLPIWSQDKDFAGSGVRVYTTGELLDLMGA